MLFRSPMASGAQFLPFFFRQSQIVKKVLKHQFCLFAPFQRFLLFFDAHFQRPFFPFEMKKLFAQLTEAAQFIFAITFLTVGPKKLKNFAATKCLNSNMALVKKFPELHKFP